MSFFVPISSFRRLTDKFRNDRVWMNLDSGSCYKKHLKGLNRSLFSLCINTYVHFAFWNVLFTFKHFTAELQYALII